MKLIITETEKNDILKKYGLLKEQNAEPIVIPNQSFVDEIPNELKSIYSKIKYKDGVIMGIKADKTFDVIEKTNPWYKPLMDILVKLSTPLPSKPQGPEGPVVDGFSRTGEPIKVDLGKLTAQDINKIYQYSKEYQEAFRNFRKTNPDAKFCAGDVFDISNSTMPVDEIRKCGAPSFDNILPSKLEQKAPFLESILFLLFRPNDPKAVTLKKNLGITIK